MRGIVSISWISEGVTGAEAVVGPPCGGVGVVAEPAFVGGLMGDRGAVSRTRRCGGDVMLIGPADSLPPPAIVPVGGGLNLNRTHVGNQAN